MRRLSYFAVFFCCGLIFINGCADNRLNSPDSSLFFDGASKDLLSDGYIANDAVRHNLNLLEVEGNVTIGTLPATQVKIIGRCGNKEVTTVTDNTGRYSFTADVKNCDPLVVEFNKESYLPNFRVIRLPPPTSPLTLDVF